MVEEKNLPPMQAAVEGTREIGLAVLATSLSLVAVFLPVAMMGGIVGRFMNSFGVTMAFAIGVSLVVAFSLTPMLSARWLRPKEIERGVTLVGPHRDDLVLGLGGLPAKGYASHGESWSFALALRLACYQLLTHGADGDDGIAGWAEGSEPVLVLDDVFAELDTRRRGRLAALVAGAEQVLITAAVPHDVPDELVGARFDVAGGQVRRVD